MNKVYIDVVAEFRKDGQLVPIFFTWEDGRKYSIDRILKIERCPSRVAEIALDAASKIMGEKNSSQQDLSLYDQFIKEAGDSNDGNKH